jgi:hypothetical protein
MEKQTDPPKTTQLFGGHRVVYIKNYNNIKQAAYGAAVLLEYGS